MPEALRSMGVKPVRPAPRSPWQNPYVERFGGTLRRELLDKIIVFNSTQLHQEGKRPTTGESRVVGPTTGYREPVIDDQAPYDSARLLISRPAYHRLVLVGHKDNVTNRGRTELLAAPVEAVFCYLVARHIVLAPSLLEGLIGRDGLERDITL